VTLQRDAGGLVNTAETAVLRGIAILAIVLHNFLAVMPQSPGENEMDFDARRGAAVVETIQADPTAAPRLLFSYFGHYGVQIFIFLSAYGLTRKFAARVPSYAAFLGSRIAKIYPSFLLAILLYLLWAGKSLGLTGPLQVLSAQWDALLLKVTLVSSVLPAQVFRPVGPWWFVPFIFQFSAVFPLLFAAERRWGTPVLIGLSAVSLGLVVAGLPVLVMTTVIGHLPEFCLGLWLGSRATFRVPAWMVVLAVPLFALGNMSQPFWYVSHLSALVLMLGLWQWCGSLVMQHLVVRTPLAWLGGLALPLFLVNGFMRQPFLGWAQATASEARVLAFALLFLLVSIVVAWCLQQADRLLRTVVRQWLGRPPRVAIAP